MTGKSSARHKRAGTFATWTAAAVAGVLVSGVVATPAHAAGTTTTYALASGANPYSGVFDADGNFYTANESNNTISKITPAGVVTQAWATLPAHAVAECLAIDAAGNIYTANMGTSTVSKVTPQGVVTGTWATLPGNSGAEGIVVDPDGNVFVANTNQSTITKVTSAGVTTTAWASLAGAGPYGLALDTDGNLYTSNWRDGTISRISPAGVVTQAWATLANNSRPEWLAFDSTGILYTANFGDDTVSKILPDATVTAAWASLPGSGPAAVAVDSWDNVYVTGDRNDAISKITPDGTVTASWATSPSRSWPTGISVSATDDVYVSNDGADSVTVVQGDPTAPGAPTNLSATGTGGRISLQFRAPRNTGHSAIIRYEVSVDGGTNWTTLTTSGTSPITATATVPTYGVTYPVKVRAVNGVDNGRASAQVVVMVSAPSVPGAPAPTPIPVPANPKAYKGPQVPTVAKDHSYKGVAATPIPNLAGNLGVGKAATLSGDGLFDFDSARLTATGRAQLAALARRLAGAKSVSCEGYTDYDGSAGHEQTLSSQRAVAVCKALVAAGARVRTSSVGYGGKRPAVVGGTAQSRAANRRVVVLVTK